MNILEHLPPLDLLVLLGFHGNPETIHELVPGIKVQINQHHITLYPSAPMRPMGPGRPISPLTPLSPIGPRSPAIPFLPFSN